MHDRYELRTCMCVWRECTYVVTLLGVEQIAVLVFDSGRWSIDGILSNLGSQLVRVGAVTNTT